MLDQLQSVFASFQKNDVKYVIIGGIAAVLYDVNARTGLRRRVATQGDDELQGANIRGCFFD